jgi:integrase
MAAKALREDPERDPADLDQHVFCRSDRKPTHPQLLSDAFKKLVSSSGLPRIRIDDLRHTHATLLLKAGVPIKVVSERLGHATPGVHNGYLPARDTRDAGGCRRRQRTRSPPSSTPARFYRLLPPSTR